MPLQACAQAQVHAVVAQPAFDAFPDFLAEPRPLWGFFQADQGYVGAAQREGGRGLAPDEAAPYDDGFAVLSDAALQAGRVLDGPHHEDLRVVGAGNGKPNRLGARGEHAGVVGKLLTVVHLYGLAVPCPTRRRRWRA